MVKYILFLVILSVSLDTRANDSFNNFNVLKSEHSFDVACSKVRSLYEQSTNSWLKSYYHSYVSHCFFKSAEFKELDLETKKEQHGKRRKVELDLIIKAYGSREPILNTDILAFLSINGKEYPHVYEYLEKLRIQKYLDSGCEVEEGSHDDCHSPLGFVKADYMEMIYYYKINNKAEDVKRLYQEYIEHPYGGETMMSSLKQGVDKLYQNHVKEHKAKSTNDSKSQKPEN